MQSFNFEDLQNQNDLLVEQLEITRQNTDELREHISLTKQLSDQAKITREQSLRLNRTNRELSDLNKNLVDQLKERNNLNRKDIDIEKDIIRSKKIQTSLETEINELQVKSSLLRGREKKAIENIISGLQEQLSINNEINESLLLEKEITGDVNKALGVTNGLAIGIQQVLKKMGMTKLSDQLGIDDAIEKTREYAKGLVEAQRNSGESGFGTNLVNNLKTAGNLAKNLGSNLAKALGPVALIAMLVDAMLNLDKTSGNIAKQFGISYSEARGINDEINSIAYNTGNIFVDAQKLNESFLTLSNSLGTNAMLSGEMLVNFTELTNQAGYSVEAATTLSKLSLITDKSSKGIASSYLGQVKLQNIKNGLAINEKALLNDINNVSKSTLLIYSKNPAELGKAAFEAKKLGLEMKQIEGISQSLLNIESSIASEFEAEVMTGKALNLERARYYALTSDIGELAKELNNQNITFNSYGKLNVLQQEAQAKALGMSREEMSNMLMEQEAIRKVGAKDIGDLKEKLKLAQAQGREAEFLNEIGNKTLQDQLKSTSTQERFQAAMAKLQDVFTQIAEPLMPIMEIFGEIFTVLGPIISLISKGMAPAFKLVGVIVNAVYETLKGIFGLFTGEGFDFTKTKSSWSGYTEALGNVPQIQYAKQALGMETKSINDGEIDSKGGLVVSGPKGSIQMDSEDTFVGNKNGIKAGTNLFDNNNGGNITILASTLGGKMDSMINKLDGLINAVNRGMTVNLDGNKVSQELLTPLAISNRKV